LSGKKQAAYSEKTKLLYQRVNLPVCGFWRSTGPQRELGRTLTPGLVLIEFLFC